MPDPILPRPYVDFELGDFVGMTDWQRRQNLHRIISIAGQVSDANGQVDWSVAGIPGSPHDLYGQAVAAALPLGWWRLDESSGTVAADSSGNGYTGTFTGSPGLGSAALVDNNEARTSTDFDGSNDHVTMGDVGDFEFVGYEPFSVETWVNLDNVNAVSSCLVSKATFTDALTANGWTFDVPGNGAGRKFFFKRQSGTSIQVAQDPGYPRLQGRTFFAVGTFDGTTIRLYVGDKASDSYPALVAESAVTLGGSSTLSMPASGSAPLLIGGCFGSPGGVQSFMNGRSQEIAVYPRAMSHAEIADRFRLGAGL